MDFAEAMIAVETLAGIEVAATVWGLGDDPSFVATLQGELRLVLPSDDFPSDPELGETAVSFEIGDHWGNGLSFWPSRFVSAEQIAGHPPGVAITTLDGLVSVAPNRPWID